MGEYDWERIVRKKGREDGEGVGRGLKRKID